MKTQDEAREMAKKLRDEAASLPDYSIFGDSNEEAKQESLAWAAILEKYADGTLYGASEATIMALDDTGEVWAWLSGGFSGINDME